MLPLSDRRRTSWFATAAALVMVAALSASSPAVLAIQTHV
jgi:hypothetical protein